MQEAALVFTSTTKPHEEKESVGTKKIVYYFQGQHRPFPQFSTPQTAYLESNYSKTLRQSGNTTSNLVSVKMS